MIANNAFSIKSVSPMMEVQSVEVHSRGSVHYDPEEGRAERDDVDENDIDPG